MTATPAALGELPAEDPCFAPGDTGLLNLRIGGLFGILAVSTIGVLIPFFTYKAQFHSFFLLVRAFAAGVVMATGRATNQKCTLFWSVYQSACNMQIHSIFNKRRLIGRCFTHSAKPLPRALNRVSVGDDYRNCKFGFDLHVGMGPAQHLSSAASDVRGQNDRS